MFFVVCDICTSIILTELWEKEVVINGHKTENDLKMTYFFFTALWIFMKKDKMLKSFPWKCNDDLCLVMDGHSMRQQLLSELWLATACGGLGCPVSLRRFKTSSSLGNRPPSRPHNTSFVLSSLRT